MIIQLKNKNLAENLFQESQVSPRRVSDSCHRRRSQRSQQTGNLKALPDHSFQQESRAEDVCAHFLCG